MIKINNVSKMLMLICLVGITTLYITSNTYSAVVLKDKSEAAQYSKKSDYAVEIDTGNTTDYSNIGSNINNTSGSSYSKNNNDLEDRFVCKTATKQGNTYVNDWSNYKVTFHENVKSATQFYVFNDDDIKYDFGLYWPDYSRLAIYYTRLSRDLDDIANRFVKGAVPRSVIIAGEVYKYVQDAVEYPYGIEYYDYYLRNVDGKLMVIECFHEKTTDMAPTYIEKIERLN